MKRTLAFLLAVVMCLSIVPIGAYATEETADDLKGWTAEAGFYLDTVWVYDGQSALGHTGALSEATSPTVFLAADTEYLVNAYVHSKSASSSATLSLGGGSVASKTYGKWEAVSFVCKGNGAAEGITVSAVGDVAIDGITVHPLVLGKEHVINGGFDNGTDSWKLNARAVYVEGEVNGHSGVISRNTTSGATVSQSVGVQDDTWYLYSADFYTTATENYSRIYLDMGDIASETELNATVGGEWQTVYGLWYSDTNTSVAVRAVIEKAFWDGSNGGSAYIDNISLRPVTVGEELVTDVGFENSGWQLGSGAAYQSGSYYLYGTKSLKLTDNATALANGGKAIAVKPHTYYNLSAFSFRSGDKSVTGKIALQSADGTELASISGIYYNQTLWNPALGTNSQFNKFGHWERIAGRWYSGENTEVYLTAKTEGTGTVYFDEVTLRAYEECFPADNIFTEGNMETNTILTAADIELTSAEKMRVRTQYMRFLANALAEFPTSVTIGGKTYNGFGEDFTLKEQKTESVRGGVKTVSVLTHTSGLVFTVESVLYEEYAAYDWTIYAENPTNTNSPVISEWNGADLTFAGENPILLGNGGDTSQYEPYTVELSGSHTVTPAGGRGTNGDSSYFDLLYGNHGVLYAVGWPGQWEMTLDNSEDASVTRMTMGQQECNTYLAPGEKIRTPLAAFVHYDGRNKDRATNRWRRWLIDCNAPLVTADKSGEGEKTLFAPAVLGNSSKQYIEMIMANEDNQIGAIKQYVENDIPIDFWWMDAGWYYLYNGELVSPTVTADWKRTGVWLVDENRFPTKLKAVSDYASKNGVKTLLWFEPERIGIRTELATDYSTVHPDMVLRLPGESNMAGLTDLGNPAAYEWVRDRIFTVMDEGGISLYREDFNIGPLSFWRYADQGKDTNGNRVGITENLYIQGHLKLWDAIRERYPDVPVDSCASGGRRNDLESMRRAVPFHRTDWDYPNQTGHHAITTEMSRWIPYFGDNSGERYSANKYARRRTVVSSAVMLELAIRDDHDWLLIRSLFDEHTELTRCNYGDYYALIDWNRNENEWAAWENYDVNLGEGYIAAFRRPGAPESVTVYPKGLEKDAQYRVWFIDANAPKTVSGETLMRDGVTFVCPCGESSDILRIVKADKAPQDRNLIGKITEVNKDNYYAGAVYADGDYNRFDIHFNMSLRDTALAVGAGKVESDVAADYGDVITIDGATVAELLAADSAAVKMDYDLVNCILRVYVKAELLPADANHTVKLSGSAVSDGNGKAVAETVYAYSAEKAAWTAAVSDLDRSGETTLADALLLLKNIVNKKLFTAETSILTENKGLQMYLDCSSR